jgi:hypothetical protein
LFHRRETRCHGSNLRFHCRGYLTRRQPSPERMYLCPIPGIT